MRHFILIIIAVAGIFTNIQSQNFQTPRSYIAYQTFDTLQIDGVGAEDVWKAAPFSQNFIDIEGEKTPRYKTNLKILWDEKYLYFLAEMEEPHVWGTLKQRDTIMFYNNDFEIFIDPDGDTHNYMEFEINALNTVWDLFIVKPYREPAPVLDSWDIRGIQSAVHIDGTLNDSRDQDKGWSVEIAIPWKVLTEAAVHNKIPKDEFWRLNFSRVNWDFQLNGTTYSRKKDEKGKYLPEYNWVWSPQGVINMHEPEHWGYVYFSSKSPRGKESFEIPQDEKIRWFLYDLYRKQKAYHRENNSWASDISLLLDEPLKIDGATIQPKLENHFSGWNIIMKSPFSGATYNITEDGKFIHLKN